MLPSTFQDSLKEEENMKRELQSRLAMAGFLQETLKSLVKEKKDAKADDDDSEEKNSASNFLQFLEKARKGEPLPPEVIIKFSSFFRDEFTLENFPRMQLVNLCRYMDIPPYGADSLLRFQLRHKIRGLKEDDQRIIYEGIDSLTKMELRQACRERGMRSTGLAKDGYREALEQWLELSVVKDVPIALLIISRTYFLREEFATKGAEEPADAAMTNLADAISSLDKDVLNEVVLEVATDEEKRSNPDVLKIKLEVLEQQNELIKEENEAREKLKQLAEEEQKAKLISAEEKKKLAAQAQAGEEENQETEIQDIPFITPETIEPATSSTDFKHVIEKPADQITEAEIVEKIAPVLPKATPAIESSPEKNIEGASSDISPESGVGNEKTEENDEEEEAELSPEELDAVKQLLSPDSLTSERAKLEKIKAAMQEGSEDGKDETDAEIGDIIAADEQPTGVSPEQLDETMASADLDELAAKTIKDAEAMVKEEAEATTTFSTSYQHIEDKVEEEATAAQDEEKEEGKAEKKLKKTVTSLKSKVESMLANIEAQMEETSIKIGDRMHLLDLDQDGILTKEEVATCLQAVLKRNLTFEEAMAIASDMDSDEDGIFTVAELNKWVDNNKLVKLVEEGREDDVDEVILAMVAEEEDASKAAEKKT
eukprot:CAMPEP_0116045468 /NCGR_PEP_ID=MMETSP0321-20121206/27635_1 /TAXON_ID=163516 /ORGANISM="Leptocylindrus danicus var. danicus, Strain B650" /LENGTH=656 /DNA_ID=CAMNT_0003526805 /DNA_START=632 /DNA_END=2602 /DNA_ORIENTATION=-